MNIKIFIPGTPQGKGRARSFLRNGKIGHYTPEKTRTYEGLIASLGLDVMRGVKPLEIPMLVTISAVFSIPNSWPAWKRQAALDGKILPTTKPDMDNIKKAIKDGLNGVVWKDDCYATSALVRKRYVADENEREGVYVEIKKDSIGCGPTFPAQIKSKGEIA
jgi:Holliday junction resolvase RusA-like endonuclease